MADYNTIASMGRYGDTELSHVSPAEKRLLEALGGSGTRNPKTGLPEYFLGTLLSVGGSLLGGLMGKKKAKQHTPEYLKPEDVRAQMLSGTGAQQSNLGDLYGKFGGLGGQMQQQGADIFGKGMGFMDQAQGLMSGQSPILDAMRQQQAQSLGDVGAQTTMGQNRMLAARGIGGGGLRSALGSGIASQLGEQARRGLLGIQQYGLQAGQGFGQLGLGMTGQAAGLGQAATGAFGGARGTQQDMMSLLTGANAAAANQMAANFGAQQKHSAEQAAQDQSFWGGIGSSLGGGIGKGIASLF